MSGITAEIFPLAPGTDIDGDGDIDLGGNIVHAIDFVSDTISDCSLPLRYSINRAGELPNIEQDTLAVSCDEFESVIVEIYAWDAAFNPYVVQPDGTIGGPNYSVCLSYLLLLDNMFGICYQGPGVYLVGSITTEEDESLLDVEVELSGHSYESTITYEDGIYNFLGLELFYDYTITPSFNEDHGNGVSTFDIVLLSKHILGTSPLDSPYKIIAGDVNNSGSISTFDMVLIRRLVLTIDTEFESNTSWRFVPADYVFPDPANPWFEPFPESIEIEDLNGDYLDLDFIAIKVGDVNGSAN